MKKRRSPSPRTPNWIDKHLADQMLGRRQAIKMTQEHLAHELKLSSKQIQKYEHGISRVSAARLYEICQVLDADRVNVRGPSAQCARIEKERVQRAFKE